MIRGHCTATMIDLNNFSYYIRLTLKKSVTAVNPTALDVSLEIP